MPDRYEIYVTLTDTTPVIHWEGPAQDRIVRLELTPEQCAAIAPRHVGNHGVTEIYERHSRCVLQKIEEQTNG